MDQSSAISTLAQPVIVITIRRICHFPEGLELEWRTVNIRCIALMVCLSGQ